jgi:hypothetical protein
MRRRRPITRFAYINEGGELYFKLDVIVISRFETTQINFALTAIENGFKTMPL